MHRWYKKVTYVLTLTYPSSVLLLLLMGFRVHVLDILIQLKNKSLQFIFVSCMLSPVW